jgi:hypothetical protein
MLSATDISGSQYGHDVTRSNKDASLPCDLWLFGYVRTFPSVIVSSITLIVTHIRSSGHQSIIVPKNMRPLSAEIPLGPVRRIEIDQCPTSGLSLSDVVQSELPTRVQYEKSSYPLV